MNFGILNYINCLPATLALEQGKVESEHCSFQFGTPAELNQKMRTGELDVSLVSAAEYLQNRHLYHRLAGATLWCDGAVESVCLYSKLPREALHGPGVKVAVTPESATSVALTEILLPQAKTQAFHNLESAESGLVQGIYQAVLLIGDQALQAPNWARKLRAQDLGRWWKEETSLPMTFAVWVARRDIDLTLLNQAESLWKSSLRWGLDHAELVAHEASRRSGLSLEQCSQYLQRIRFEPTQASEAGLREFSDRWARRRLPGAKIDTAEEPFRVTAL